MKKKQRFSRVDIQVSILTASIVILSVLTTYLLTDYLTYQDMIVNLQDQAQNIYQYVEKRLNKQTFLRIQEKEDLYEESYLEMQRLLSDVRDITGVMYLYTAKKNGDGKLIYVIDGLDSASADFRYPGDMIEEDIWETLEFALEDNIILPDRIKSTDWGHIFISYFPIHGPVGEVIGVLGIEFEAEHQFQTFRMIRLATPLLTLITCAITVLISVRMFKRISNPTYRDLFNTDYLTGLKNRNAFETDMNNFSSRPAGKAAILSIDLNGLKKVNDTLGHSAGDRYIRRAGEIVQDVLGEDGLLYRIGGDEYAAILWNRSAGQMEQLVGRIRSRPESDLAETPGLSLSVGYALVQPEDHDLFDTYRRADAEMYRDKKAHVHETRHVQNEEAQ